MWDKRYDMDEYAYGVHPNDFLAENYQQLPNGNILCIAEGEGRNAVFLARHGYSVTAVDSSAIGLEKAQRLATDQGVNITTVCADLADFDFGHQHWDGIVSIFCPLPSRLRQSIHARIVHALKVGGIYLLEAYTPEQLNYKTGGGNSADTMQSRATLGAELTGLEFLHLQELKRTVIEGIYHTGLGSVVQCIARKPD